MGKNNKTVTRRLTAPLFKSLTGKKEITDGDSEEKAKQEMDVLTARLRRDNWLFVMNLLIWTV